MNALLWILAAVLFWLGIDALRLSRHQLPPTQSQKEKMMFGQQLRKPLNDKVRIFAERHYPFATGQSMKIYGWLFISGGVVSSWFAWNL